MKKKGRFSIARINLESEHSVELTGLLAGALYAFVIVIKGTLTLLDTFVLLAIYSVYVIILIKLPPQDEEGIADMELVPRYILTRSRWYRNILIWACFIIGGVGILLVAEPFLESAIGLSVVLGVPSFMLIQWLAPFLSEFPEKVSAFYWAKSIVKAPMALMNLVSSGVAELTLLIAIIPVVFCFSLGEIHGIHFDWAHRAEIMLTATQGILGFVILCEMNLKWFEALGVFVLWFTQILFVVVSLVMMPFVANDQITALLWNDLHVQVLAKYTIIYWIWIIIQLTFILFKYKKIPSLIAFKSSWKTRKG